MLNCYCWWGQEKAFFVFNGVKWDVKCLNEEYKAKCIVASSASGWLDNPLTEQYCCEVIGRFTFVSWCIVVWDSFSCHLTPGVDVLLNKGKIDPVIVPGGCTKYIQASDLLKLAQANERISQGNVRHLACQGRSWINCSRKHERAIKTTNDWMVAWGLEEVTSRYH